MLVTSPGHGVQVPLSKKMCESQLGFGLERMKSKQNHHRRHENDIQLSLHKMLIKYMMDVRKLRI
jgi:hypothetical protein